MPPSKPIVPSTSAFPKIELAARNRVVWTIEGPGKGGKTDLALWGPKPLLYLPFDPGWEGTLEKFLARGMDIRRPPGGFYRQRFDEGVGNQQYVANQALALWDRFRSDLRNGAKAGFRTIVVDTASEAWHTFVSARYGKTTQIPQHLWGPLYYEFQNEMRIALDDAPNTNLFLIHQLKDETVEELDREGKKVARKTGRQLRDGCKKMEFFYQAEVRVRFDAENKMFIAQFMVCRQNMKLSGEEFALPEEQSFQALMAEVAPDVDPDTWSGE